MRRVETTPLRVAPIDAVSEWRKRFANERIIESFDEEWDLNECFETE